MKTTINDLELTCSAWRGGVMVERVCTAAKCAVLPAEIGGLPVLALGDRAFAPHGGADAPDHREIREIILPHTLEQVGDYTFYNCTGMTTLRLYDRTRHWGGGCLMNCRSLSRLELTAAGDGSPVLCYFAEELSRELDVTVRFPDGEDLRLIFPEYEESYENNDPAHHFDFHLYGPGFPYHQAFRDKRLDLGLFDGAWEDMLRREHDEHCALRLAWYRLRYPRGLSAAAGQSYQDYLDTRRQAAMLWMIARRDCRDLSWFLSRFSPTREELSAAAELARASGVHEAVALLLEEQHRRFPPEKNKTFEL